MKAAVLLTGILSLGVMSNISAQVLYKWVDDANVTHFSEQPPQGVEAERTSIRIHKSGYRTPRVQSDTSARNAAVATRKQQEKEQATEEKSQANNDQQNRVENCEKANTRLVKYNTSRRLYRVLEDGEREYLTDDELDNERAGAQKLVDEWCD